MSKDNRIQIKVRLGTFGRYRYATLTVYREEPDQSVGFPGTFDVESIEIDPVDARELLVDIIDERLERAINMAHAFDYLDNVRIDL